MRNRNAQHTYLSDSGYFILIQVSLVSILVEQGMLAPLIDLKPRIASIFALWPSVCRNLGGDNFDS